MLNRTMLAALCLAIFSQLAVAGDAVYSDVVEKIEKEARSDSEIMENAFYLTDVYGPRLALSPDYDSSVEWILKKLESYGLNNVHADSYGEVGEGWSNDYLAVHMLAPRKTPLMAMAKGWSQSTPGAQRGHVVVVDFDQITDLEQLDSLRKSVKGAIVFTSGEQSLEPHFEPDATRLTKEELDEMAAPRGEQEAEEEPAQEPLTRIEVEKYLVSKGAVAFVDPGRSDFGTIVGGNAGGRDNQPWEKDAFRPVSLVMATEHFNRIVRLVNHGMGVTLEIEVANRFYGDQVEDYNVIAEIPGTDLADEVVMIGAHLDGVHGSTGASDNASGVVVAMETMRILKKLGVQPRRTIRLALWGGEEIGLLGSRGYVKKYLGDPETQQYLPEQSKISAYYNLDTGTGKIRGVWLQENEKVRPIFKEWLKPLHGLGATHLDPTNTEGTDHESFDAVGVPGFTFIQDWIDYETRTTHSNMDNYDRLLEEDLIQASIVMASFAYQTAMRDEMLPRVMPAPLREAEK